MTWEMNGLPHKFPTVRENVAKPIVWGKSGKLILILFPQYGGFFPIKFPSYGILHHMGNTWVFSPNFPQHSETYQMGNAWKIASLIFSIKWVTFSIRFPSCHVLHHMGNAWVSSSISQGMRNSRKTHQMRRAQKIDFPENPTKPIACGKSGKLVLIFFPQYG